MGSQVKSRNFFGLHSSFFRFKELFFAKKILRDQCFISTYGTGNLYLIA
jgi:hypothetical protein